MIAAVSVGLALIGTGAVVGILSGASPLKRALRQLAIGFGAAAATYALGPALRRRPRPVIDAWSSPGTAPASRSASMSRRTSRRRSPS